MLSACVKPVKTTSLQLSVSKQPETQQYFGTEYPAVILCFELVKPMAKWDSMHIDYSPLNPNIITLNILLHTLYMHMHTHTHILCIYKYIYVQCIFLFLESLLMCCPVPSANATLLADDDYRMINAKCEQWLTCTCACVSQNSPSWQILCLIPKNGFMV